MKKIISILLTVTMLFAICSVGIPAAAETTASAPQSGRIENELTATASDSFGSMLSEKLEEGQPTDEENANKILSVEVSGDVASVELETVTDAVVLVGVYDEEDDRMLASGTEHVTPDDTTVQVLLNAVTMPEYFVIRAFLVDEEENAPLCKSYESMLYTREMQEFLQKTTDDFAEESVLNLDDSEENNFAVFSDDTTLIESSDDGTNTVAVADDESKTYVIENADESFTSLQPGEVFSYPYGDNGLLIVKIKTIAVEGTTVTITGDEIELDDVFDYVKLDNTMAVDEEQYDPSTCGDGVTFTGFDDIAATGSDGSKSDLAATGYDISVGKTSKLNFNIFKDDIEHSVELSAGLELELGVKLRIYITTAYQYLELKTEYSSKIYGKIEGTIKKDFPLGVIPIGPFWGVTLELKPAFAFEAKASVEFNLTFKGALGFSVSNTSGIQNLSESPKAKFNTKLEGSIFVGLKVTSELNFLKEVAKADLSGTLGAEAEAELDRGDYAAQYSDVSGSAVSGVGDVTAKVAQPKEPDTTHDCQTCFKGQISAKLSLDTKATLLNLPLLTFNKNFLTVKRKLSDFHYSKDFNEFGFCQCPHKRNKISLSVFTEDKKSADFTAVTCTYIDKNNRSYQCLNTQTDSKGRLALMLSAGKYKLTFSHEGYQDLTKTIEVVDHTQAIKLTLKKVGSGGSGDVQYTLNNGVLTVYGTGKIADWKFSNRDDIQKVIIKKGITGIGEGAFACCYSLTSVTIPDSVTSIGDLAFEWCGFLTSVTIPDSVTSIGDLAFADCHSLTSVTIPDSVTSIGEGAFADCHSLTSVTIPDSVTSIGEWAFAGCSSLTSVTIPDSVTSIGDEAFMYCDSLTSVTIPDSVTSIGNWAFSSCYSMSDIYYTGSESEWNAIKKGSGAIPSKTVIHYNSSGIAATGAASAPVGAEPNITPVGEEPENDPFTRENLVPGSEALLIVVSGEGRDAAPDSPDILYIAQTAADENGTARFNIDPSLWSGEFSAAIFGQCAHVRCEWETFNEGTQDETQLYRCADCGRLMDTGGDDPHAALIGDADGDGSVTAADVTCIQRDRVGIMTGIDATAFLQGDVDKNGVVEIIDATYIQRYLAGMEIPYSIG